MTAQHFLVTLSSLLMIQTAFAAAPIANPYDPVAAPEAIVEAEGARFTMLTPSLIRLEWSPTGRFEDRASHAFVNRRLPVPAFEAASQDGWIIITTEALTLRYRDGAGRFAPDNLNIAVKTAGIETRWAPGTENKGNLLGTYRTLDGVSGATSLEPGILSRDGWTLVDDSSRLLFDNSDWPWAAPRAEPDAMDWYFFAYGRDFPRALRDFTAVAGRIPLPPRYTFGAWWSRYWAYSDEELRALVGEFQAHGVPLDVLVVDMDWHLDGWTGYTWNPKYFPDPEGFLAWTKQQGLRVPLNLHPAEGVGKHEQAFPEVAAAMGLDPEKTDRVPFNCSDRRFVEAYFKHLHHPLERQGIDFWWMDWQQGPKSGMDGLDPLFWLNYLHWTDWERNPGAKDERPLIFSRWGGLGNHRYQIGFSGDTFCNWPSLAFQPFFTSTAGNVGYAYWSHDIGGHQPGPVDPELYARWIQWGALSPALRTHTTKNPASERRIWAFDDETYRVAKEAWLLRYALLPYIYTSARATYDTSLPLCRPLYYEWPSEKAAYTNTHEYLFGPDLLVAPVSVPRDPATRCVTWRVWLPPGDWTHWYSGRTYRGPGDIHLVVPLDEIPLFVRDGAVIPAMHPGPTTDAAADPLVLHIFSGDKGECFLYEDDGTTRDYERSRSAKTPISFSFYEGHQATTSVLRSGWARNAGGACRMTIGPTAGDFAGMKPDRAYEIRMHNMLQPASVSIGDTPLAPAATADAAGWTYDPQKFELVIRTPRLARKDQVLLSVQPSKYGQRFGTLQRGPAGYIRLLNEAQAGLAAAAPAEAAKTRELLLRLATSEDWSADDTTALRASAIRVAEQVAALPVETPRRLEFLTRLLGLSASLDVRFEPESGTLEAVVESALDPPLGITERIPAKVLFSKPANWQTGKSTQEMRPAVGTEQVVAIRTPLTLDGLPQPCALSATVIAKLGEQEARVPVAREVLSGINGWWIVGPFDAPAPGGLALPFPPEKELDLKASYEGKDDAAITWKRYTRPLAADADLASEFLVNFADVFGHRPNDAAAYALTYLYAPRAMEVTLAVGSDDGLVVWLNGTELHRNVVGRPFTTKQDRVQLKLREGANALLLKVDQHGGDWCFAAHLESEPGRTATEVRAALD